MVESIILNALNQIASVAQALTPAEVDAVTFFLTFFLVFAISYASTSLIPILTGGGDNNNENKKAIRIIISIAIAYFSAINPMVTTAIQRVFPTIAILGMGTIAFIITIYFVFPNTQTAEKVIKFIIGPLIIGVLVLILWGTITQWETPVFEQHPEGIVIAGVLISNYDIGIALLILGVILFILFSTELGSGSDKKRLIDKLLGG
mgnify:CR=1 FL=1